MHMFLKYRYSYCKRHKSRKAVQYHLKYGCCCFYFLMLYALLKLSSEQKIRDEMYNFL